MALDLPNGYTLHPLNCCHTETMDPAKKPEWYHRLPQSRSTEVSSSYRTRSRAASSYSSLSSRMMDNSLGNTGGFQLHPEMDGAGHCREVDQCPENIGSYSDSTLAQGLGLYHTGVNSNPWHHPGFYDPDQAESPVPDSSAGEDSDSDSDVIFLVSTTKDTLLCSSLSRDSISPIVEPLSPAALSLDEGRGCFLLPQPISSPSPESTDSEESSDSSVDTPVRHTRPVVVLQGLPFTYRDPVGTPVEVLSDDSDVIEVPVTNEKKKIATFTDNIPCNKTLADETIYKGDSQSPQPRGLRRSTRIRNSTSFMHGFIDSMSHHNSARPSLTRSGRVGFYKDCSDSGDMIDSTERLSSSEEEPLSQPTLAKRESTDSDNSESDLGPQIVRKGSSQSPQRRLANGQQSSHIPSQVTNKRKKSHLTSKGPIPTKQQPKSSPGSKRAVNKSAPKRRRREKSTQTSQSDMFSPRETEIALKYAKYKKKSDSKSDSFRPFVHIDHRECTVVNCQEDEVSTRRNGAHQQTGSLFGFVPKTSCFRLGRLSSESKCQPMQACCLCGESTNTMGLGDLHGPYYPTGTPLDCQEQNCRALSPDHRRNGLKEDERLHGFRNRNGGETADEDGILFSDCERSITASAKKPLMDTSHSPAAEPLHTNERWIHEDCGIWSAGVFLVRGKLYGLEEAARLGQEMVSDRVPCLCSRLSR